MRMSKHQVRSEEVSFSRRRLLQSLAAWGCVSRLAVAEEKSPPKVRQLPVTGEPSVGWDQLDDFLQSFVIEHQVPGASIAVAEGDALVFARGLGYADRDTGSPVLPTSRFRVASLSKPLTAIAVARLIEQGKVHWDDAVLTWLKQHSELGIRDLQPRDDRWQHVTVRHVLQHRGGWDRRLSFDPMFRSVEIALWHGVPPPASSVHVIRYMLAQPLDFDPGTRSAYSNFGYCLLGRVLEAVTGSRYEQVVRHEVLEPSHAEATELGATRHRKDFEVRYYADDEPWAPSVFAKDLGKPVPPPYGAWYLEAMDAHGGWISTCVDLVRITASLFRDDRPLLSPETLTYMLAPPDGPLGMRPPGGGEEAYFGCGWMVRPVQSGRNCWHTGSLPGTSTLLVHRYDKMCWAVLFNRRKGPDGRPLAQIIDPLLHPLIR